MKSRKVSGRLAKGICRSRKAWASGKWLEITLPTTAPLGAKIKIQNAFAPSFKIIQNAGQQIIFGNLETTEGIAGYIRSIQKGDSCSLICVRENEVFMLESSIGNFEVI